MNRNRRPPDAFSVAVGAIAAASVIVVTLAIGAPDLTLRMFAPDPREFQASAEERIRPLSQVYRPGEEHGAPEPVVAHAEPVAPVVTALTGPQVYNEACIACHGTGIGGAPKVGDAKAWAPRIAQGIAILREHAVVGYQGSAGYMPPKGARIDLSDKEVHDAVDYMVAQSR